MSKSRITLLELDIILIMNIYKNIQPEEVLKLKDLVKAEAGQIVSKTLIQNPHISITLFAFSKGEEISTHESNGDALVTVLEGTGRFTIGGKDYKVKKHESIVMPANVPHAVNADEDFKMILTVAFPE